MFISDPRFSSQERSASSRVRGQEAFGEPARWADKYLCRRGEKLRKRAVEVGLEDG
jgi:hypothetical protein